MTPNLKVSDPQAEAGSKSEGFVSAVEAREDARKNFRVAVDTLLNDAIKGGQTSLELNITQAEPEFVAEISKDLEAAGYTLTKNTHVRGAAGQKILTVKF